MNRAGAAAAASSATLDFAHACARAVAGSTSASATRSHAGGEASSAGATERLLGALDPFLHFIIRTAARHERKRSGSEQRGHRATREERRILGQET